MLHLVTTASCPGTWFYWKKTGPILFAPSLQVLIDIEEIPWSLLSSGLESRSTISLIGGWSSPFILMVLH